MTHLPEQKKASFDVEETSIGPQSLVPGVVPLTALDRLLWRAAAPMAPRKPQRPCDLGLFDLAARDQLELFGISGRRERDKGN